MIAKTLKAKMIENKMFDILRETEINTILEEDYNKKFLYRPTGQ